MTTIALRRNGGAAAAAAITVGGQPAIPIEAEGFDMPALARKLWRPMLAMGLMAVMAGIVVGIVQASSSNALHISQLAAWNPGLLFLGVGLLLSAVTFLLAVILGSLRDGGVNVQRALGASALILGRPLTGKLFPAAMMMGLMLLVAGLAIGFVQASRVANDPTSAADIAAWVGPLRFAGITLILSGVALALLTIVNALRFQSDRIAQIDAERRN